jgi:hypothetical protein
MPFVPTVAVLPSSMLLIAQTVQTLSPTPLVLACFFKHGRAGRAVSRSTPERIYCSHSAPSRFGSFHERRQRGHCRRSFLTQNCEANQRLSLLAPADPHNRQCCRVSVQEFWQLLTGLRNRRFPFLVIFSSSFQQPWQCICSDHTNRNDRFLGVCRCILFEGSSPLEWVSFYCPKTFINNLQPLAQFLAVTFRLFLLQPECINANSDQNTSRQDEDLPSAQESDRTPEMAWTIALGHTITMRLSGVHVTPNKGVNNEPQAELRQNETNEDYTKTSNRDRC